MGQVLPHAPQLLGSEAKLTQAGPHRSSGLGQTKSHTPSTQSGVPLPGAVHVAPQPSQWLVLVFRSTHLPEQTVLPSAQATGPPSLGSMVVPPAPPDPTDAPAPTRPPSPPLPPGLSASGPSVDEAPPAPLGSWDGR